MTIALSVRSTESTSTAIGIRHSQVITSRTHHDRPFDALLLRGWSHLDLAVVVNESQPIHARLTAWELLPRVTSSGCAAASKPLRWANLSISQLVTPTGRPLVDGPTWTSRGFALGKERGGALVATGLVLGYVHYGSSYPGTE